MDKAERKRLKQAGKAAVEAESKRIQSLLREANPAAIGSADWVRGYRDGVNKERAARGLADRTIPMEEAARHFVLNFKSDDFRNGYPAVSGWFYRCDACGDLVPSKPARSLGCHCGNIFIDIEQEAFSARTSGAVTLVELIGKTE